MKITVKVYDVSKKLYLRQALGEATLEDGSKIDLANIIPTGDLHMSFGDKSYVVKISDVLEQIIKQRKPKKATL